MFCIENEMFTYRTFTVFMPTQKMTDQIYWPCAIAVLPTATQQVIFL